jgi:hypothetical protein
LTPANLTVANFSKMYSTPVDGQIYAQPLYVPNVTVASGPNAGPHSLAIVATQHDSLYAVDVNSGVVVWQTSFLTTGLPGATTITSMPAGDTGSTDTAPEIGICGTPVLDTTTKLLYVAAKTKQILNGNTASPNYVYTLYEIDITNGNATPNANIVASNVIADTVYSGGTYSYRTNAVATAAQDPFVVGTGDGAITVNGQSRVYFNAMRQMNRPGLILTSGTVFVGFGSHGDNGPYHGWLIGFNKQTLAITQVLNLTPNLGLGGLWAGGGIPVVDAYGYIYVVTGNGGFDGYNNNGVTAGLNSLGMPVNGDYGDCIVKIAPDPTTSVGNQNINGWGLRVVDYFSPFNNAALDAADTDLGSGGCLLLPDSAGSAAHPHLLVDSGKGGHIYLVDRDSMGKFSATTDNVVQSQQILGECFSTPAFFNGLLYYFAASDNGKCFTVANAAMSTAPGETPDQTSWPGSTPSISANGTNNGIIWTYDRSSAELRAYSANLGTEIWTSAMAPNNRDQLGTVSKFAVPTVADGRVLAGTTTALVVYGPPIPPTSAPAAPTSLAAFPVSALQINLTWTDNSTNEAGFAIEQSPDGVNFTQIATVGVNVTNYSVISNLQAGTSYFFRVRAFNTYQGTSYSAYTNSANATTLSTSSATLNFSSGFSASASTLQYNSAAKIVNNRAEITDGGANETATIWSKSPQQIGRFSTQFTFQETNATADGFTFSIQNNSTTTIGAYGGNLSYTGTPQSIAIKFDLYNNQGEGSDSTGLYVNGAVPTVPDNDMTNTGINLHSGDVFLVALNYDGTTLTETIQDTVTNAFVTYTYTINIPATIGSNTAYVGFTGGSGGWSAVQDILTWIYSPLPTTPPAAPTALSATAASGTQINLAWTDNSNNESGFIVSRATSGSGPFAQVGVVGPGVTTYMDTALLPNTTYYYQVKATNSAGLSAPTNTASALTPIPPVTPSNAQPATITSTSIAMTWSDNANNETGYNILRKMTTASNFSLIATLPANSTSYTDSGLAPGTSYDYHIQAYNLAGYSDFSGFTAVTLPSSSLPFVTLSATGPVAVNGVATGQVTFTRSAPFTSSLTVPYTVSGSAKSGTDYTALSGTLTIPAGSASASVTVSSMAGATSNATVTVGVASSSSFQAGSPASATVVIENSSYNATAQTAYASSAVAGTGGGMVNLTFAGLPGSPSGVVYVWYLNGTAFTTTTSPTYAITNALASQSGTYSVYAYAPGGATGSASWNVTITNPPLTLVTSTGSLTVNDGSSSSFTVGLASAPLANVTVNVSVSGNSIVTVSPTTITLTPTSYQNQTVAVSAGLINSSTANRSSTVTLSAGTSTVSVAVTDAISDAQKSPNLTATSYPLTGSNIGASSAGDSSVRADGAWWLDGSGPGGVSGTSDSFHFESQSLAGNFQMVVQLEDVVGAGATAPLAGLMIRDGTGAGSNFLALAGSAAPKGGYSLISRTSVNSAASTTVTSGANLTYTYPAAWMMLTRVGNSLHAFVSSDGITFYEVTNSTSGVTWSGMSSALSIGVFASSGSAANASADMTNFSIGASSYQDADIGAPGVAGSYAPTSTGYTVSGGGYDVWNNFDQFNFLSQSATGDGTLMTQVLSITNTDPWAKSGLMFRNSTSPGSAFVSVFENPSGVVELQWRDTDNGMANTTNQVGPTTPAKWLKLVKSGTTFSGYYASTTGTPASTDWVLVTTHTTSLNASYLSGFAVTAHNNTLLNTSTFSSQGTQTAPAPTPTPTPPPAPTPAPSSLTDLDIGQPGLPGSATFSGGLYTVTGGGTDIWNGADQFNFDYQPNTTDLTIIAHVDSIQNTDPWAKSGVMFRNSTLAGSAFVGVFENPSGVVELQWRDTDNGQANTTNQTGPTGSAKWLKLVKSGTTFTSYYATTTTTPAATDWILLAVHTTAFTNSTYLGGFAVTAHNNSLSNTSVFSGYSQQ